MDAILTQVGQTGIHIWSIPHDLTYKTKTLNVHLFKTLQEDTVVKKNRDYVADTCKLYPGDQY